MALTFYNILQNVKILIYIQSLIIEFKKLNILNCTIILIVQ